MRGKSALIVYKTYIRPVIEYGCEAWLPMSQTHLDDLQIIQNNALRICLGHPLMYSTELMHTEAKICSIEERLKARTAKFMIKAMNNGTLVGRELLKELQEPRLSPICKSVRSTMDIMRPLLTIQPP